jgi:hypothetical protein
MQTQILDVRLLSPYYCAPVPFFEKFLVRWTIAARAAAYRVTDKRICVDA